MNMSRDKFMNVYRGWVHGFPLLLDCLTQLFQLSYLCADVM